MIALPWIIVTLGPLIAWGLLFGLRQSWATILRAVKHYLTSSSTLRRLADPFGISSQASVHQGEKALGDEALQAEPTTAGFIAGMAGLIEFHGFTVKYIARDTLAAVQALQGHAIPKAIGSRTRTTREHAEAANQRARQAARLAAAAAAAAFAGLRLWGRAAHHSQVTANKALAKASAGAIAVPLERPWIQSKRIEDAIGRAFERWKKWLWAGALGGALAIPAMFALTRNLPWYRCSNVNRAMRQLCRTPHNFLGDLLALTADFFILTNICRVIPWLEAAYADVAEPVVAKLTEVASRVCAPPHGRPALLEVPELHLPAATFTQLYLP